MAHTYAWSNGIVFDTSNKQKSNRQTHPDSVTVDMQTSLQQAIQGGTLAITHATTFLGAAEDCRISPALAVLRQIEIKGDSYGRKASLHAAEHAWPLAARYYFVSRSQSVVQNLLPLSIGHTLTALRLNALQARWAHMILAGRKYLSQPRLTRTQSKLILADLGWKPLWNTALTAAITLLEKCAMTRPSLNTPDGQRKLNRLRAHGSRRSPHNKSAFVSLAYCCLLTTTPCTPTHASYASGTTQKWW